jgi:hypothetical protein
MMGIPALYTECPEKKPKNLKNFYVKGKPRRWFFIPVIFPTAVFLCAGSKILATWKRVLKMRIADFPVLEKVFQTGSRRRQP